MPVVGLQCLWNIRIHINISTKTETSLSDETSTLNALRSLTTTQLIKALSGNVNPKVQHKANNFKYTLRPPPGIIYTPK